MTVASPWFLWLPLAAVVAHLLEKFVYPGGFAAWYRWYDPDRAASVTTRFLVTLNVALVALALLPPVFGSTARGYAMWTIVAAIGGANAVFHTSGRRRAAVGTRLAS